MKQVNYTTGKVTPQTAWDALSMAQKSEMMKVAVRHGITNLQEIKQKYNESAEGGDIEEEGLPPITPFKQRTEVIITPDQEYNQYLNTLPDNQRFTPNEAYDSYFYWKLNGRPKNFEEAYNKGMFHYDHSDKGYHANSIAFGEDGVGYFMKPKTHDTVHMETDWFNHGIVTEEGGKRRFVTDKERQELEDFRRRFELIDDPNRPNFFMYAPRNVEAEGGGIHIKPSHRGRLTELKERTGKSEAELYNDGNPAHKKMVVFARNSRKWKHGEGGNLFDGTSEDTQQMQIGLKVTNGWKPYTTEDILANARRLEEQRQAREAALSKLANDYLTTSNDATSIANGRPQNRHLEERGIRGAKAHRAWEEEHPIATAWGNVLGAVPFAVASYPFVTSAVVPSVTALGDAAAATTAGKALTSALSPVMTAATTSWYGTPAWEWANTGLNAIFSAHGLNTAMEEKGVSPTTALELAPMLTLGKPIKTAADNIERRGIEVAMRSGAGADGLQNSIEGFRTLRKTAEGRERLKRIGNYILTGDRKGIDGTYNSLSVMKDSNTPGAVRVYRGSEVGDTYDASKKDLIDAFLYGETIDPSFGLTKIAQGENFGVHAPYIAENYASKASKIPVYEVNTPFAIPEAEVTPSGKWIGRDAGTFTSKEGSATNVAGHLKQTGMTAEGMEVEQGQDIWKFLGKDYWKKWLENGKKRGPLEKVLLKAGLHEVNRLGTPVITRTKWAPDYQTYDGWNKPSVFSDITSDFTFGSSLKSSEMDGLFKVVGRKSFALDDFKLPTISVDFADLDYFTK